MADNKRTNALTLIVLAFIDHCFLFFKIIQLQNWVNLIVVKN